MKELIIYSNFFNDIDTLHNLVSTMDYVNNNNNLEVLNFQQITDEHLEFFRYILNDNNINIINDISGIFRKPSNNIQTANTGVIVIALEDNTLYHKGSIIKLNKNQVVFISNGDFYFEESPDKILQFFYIINNYKD